MSGNNTNFGKDGLRSVWVEYLFRIAAVILIGAALYFWWRQESDAAFVAAGAGAVAWFLGVRNRIRRTSIEEEASYDQEMEN